MGGGVVPILEWVVPALDEGTYPGWRGGAYLGQRGTYPGWGYLHWMGYLTWMGAPTLDGGTHLGKGVPTLNGGYLPWTGVATLDGDWSWVGVLPPVRLDGVPPPRDKAVQ